MRADRVAFEREAKARRVKILRGIYGELLTARSRFAWWLFYAGWRARQVYDVNRREKRRRKCS